MTSGYRLGDVTMPTARWFLAAARTIAGPPTSIFSITSASVIPAVATVSRNG